MLFTLNTMLYVNNISIKLEKKWNGYKGHVAKWEVLMILSIQIALCLWTITHDVNWKWTRRNEELWMGSGLVSSFLPSLWFNLLCCGLCNTHKNHFFSCPQERLSFVLWCQSMLTPIMFAQIYISPEFISFMCWSQCPGLHPLAHRRNPLDINNFTGNCYE